MLHSQGYPKLMENNNNPNNYHDFMDYQKLPDGTHMSIDSSYTSQTDLNGTHMSEDYISSVGSCGSDTRILNHPGLRSVQDSSKTGNSKIHHRPIMMSDPGSDDRLAIALTDPRLPTETLRDYQNWTVDLSKLHIEKSFAQGAFGKLYRGEYNGVDVAIKLLQRTFDQDRDGKAQLMEQQFYQEVVMLTKLNHPNIVKFVGMCMKPEVFCIVTEYEKGGSLRSFLMKRQNKAVPLKLAVRQALDVARGMEYVHREKLIHRDLKSDNLLIAGDKSIKIADFGVARIEVKPEGMTPETGTYRWMAPEMIQHRPYTQKVDVYSFGIVLWELVTGKLPFDNMTAVQAAFAVVNRGARPVVPADCYPALANLMSRCWDTDPDVRPTFAEIVVILEEIEKEVFTNVRSARFRCCMHPMTIE
ncbi:hypothetical protein LUZ60_017272 [Juncus effusus]|nr:hypothetical protein LUZ60_017272 [Juncus effusus]